MESIQNSSRTENERVAFGRLLWVGPLAGVIAAAAHAVVYLVAFAAGAIPQSIEIPNAGGPLSFTPVVFNSFVPALVGALLFALLGWLTGWPARNFRVLATVVLVLSFATPFTIPSAPLAMVATLLLIHVVAAVVVVGILTTLAHAR